MEGEHEELVEFCLSRASRPATRADKCCTAASKAAMYATTTGGSAARISDGSDGDSLMGAAYATLAYATSRAQVARLLEIHR